MLRSLASSRLLLGRLLFRRNNGVQQQRRKLHKSWATGREATHNENETKLFLICDWQSANQSEVAISPLIAARKKRGKYRREIKTGSPQSARNREPRRLPGENRSALLLSEPCGGERSSRVQKEHAACLQERGPMAAAG